jgi:prolyl oligopeptidase
MQHSIVISAVMASFIGTASAAVPPPPPATPSGTATDTYFGITEKDPYRWLENGADPKVHEWSVAQDARTRAYLDALPVRAKIHDRLMALLSKTSPSYVGLYPAGGKIFATYVQPPKQQPMIAVLGPDADPAKARVVVDPNALNPAGTTAIDWFVPSRDGTKLAVSLSDNGSEDGTLHIFDVATGQDSALRIPGVQYPTAGGSLAWRKDGTGFWYTRYPGADAPAERQHFYQQVFYHKLGEDPAADTYVAGKDFPKVAEIALSNRQSPGPVLMSVANGDGGEFAHYVIADNGTVAQVTHFADHAIAGQIGPDGTLYLVSHDGAPRGKLLALPPGDFALEHARTLIPQTDGVIEGGGEFGGAPITITNRALYVREIVGGPSRVAAYTHDGEKLPDLPLPGLAAVDEVVPLSGGQLLYSVATYLRPPYFERFDEASAKASESQLAETSPVHFDDAAVTRVFATSKDGTKVPLNIIALKTATQNSANPTLLYGYGGYNISEVPYFLGARGRIWLDGKGVLALANLRGGGEYGEAWHEQGALTHKQNVFDDFYACAQYLVAQRWTSTKKLAALGGSNGGLLMGAMMTQHPNEFRAIVSQVGIYDMLRVELDPNGAFNTTEFGSVKDQAQFRALAGYSPYHHVTRGTKYPAIFMATGEHDGRVNPMHSRKMIAALQAADTSGLPVLLSINSHAGHGIGSALSIRVDQMADFQAFLFGQLGMSLGGESVAPSP